MNTPLKLLLFLATLLFRQQAQLIEPYNVGEEECQH